MNTPNDQGRAPASGKRVVIAGVILFAVALGGTGLVMKLLPARPAPATQPAGAAKFDVDRARREVEDLQQRAMQVISAKQQVDLVPQAKALVERYPRFAPAHLLLAQLHINKGQAREGYESLEMSLRYDSQQPEVQLLAGTIAQQLERLEDASRHYAAAVGLDPTNGKLRVYLAQSYMVQNRYDEARLALLEALRINSHQHDAYYALSQLDARQGMLEQAITQVNRAIEHLPADEKEGKSPREAYVRWLAKLLQRDNRPDESLQALEKLDTPQRRSAAVLEDMAVAWQMIGRPVNGAKLYEEALGYQPDAWPLAQGAARWYLKAGDKPAARRMVDALRRINPDAPALAELTPQVQ